MNSFWDNVAQELEYLGMTNKALAEKVGITASNIGKGQKQGSSPSVETAVKIAEVLGVSVEYLVTGCKNDGKQNSINSNNLPFHLYHKYQDLIEKCETLPKEKVKLLSEVASGFQNNSNA